MTSSSPQRPPRAFAPDDPAVNIATPATGPSIDSSDGDGEATSPPVSAAAASRRSVGWGGLLLSAMAGLTALASGVTFTRFVTQALERQDWVGWTATGLLALAGLSAAIILMREITGLFRLARLNRLRKDVVAALRDNDAGRERSAVAALKALYAGRHDASWGLKRLTEHEADVRDMGDLLRLADRELVAPLDVTARGIVLKSAKRVSVVTALSPMAWAAMLYVVVENLRMLRALASLYGGRPGFVGALRLARLVVGHIIATGGVAMTDDLLGQFLGQDVLRRLSRRLGEGAFNGALTARIGTAAIEVTRPLPFLEAEPVRIRDLLPELFRRSATTVKS